MSKKNSDKNTQPESEVQNPGQQPEGGNAAQGAAQGGDAPAQDGESKKDGEASTKQSSGHPSYYYYARGNKASYYYGSSGGQSTGPGYYYGGSVGGPGYYYGQSGSGPGYYYGGNENPHDQDDSFFGRITLARSVRVALMKWPTLVVAVVLGIAAGFAFFKASPILYKANCMIEISIKPKRVTSSGEIIVNDPNAQGTTREIFNTRLAMLRSTQVIKLVADRVRTDYTELKTMRDENLWTLLRDNVTLSIKSQSRLVNIEVIDRNPKTAQAIANAYAQTAVTFSQNQNKDAIEAGVARLISMQESQMRAVNEAPQERLTFSEENQLGPMVSEKATLHQIHTQLNGDLVHAEAVRYDARQIYDFLTSIMKDPSKFSSIPSDTPRGGEISEVQKLLREAMVKRDELIQNRHLQPKHPEVVEQDGRIEVLEKQYVDAVERARQTAAANLGIAENKVHKLESDISDNFRRQQELDLKIASIEAQIRQLDLNYKNAADRYQEISARLEEGRIAINDTLDTIRIIGEGADLPKAPFSPVASLNFSVGALAGFAIGFLFILALDRVEDKITSSDDIRKHMNTTVLSLVPRIPRTKRTELATLAATKKFSRIAEAFAGLRGLLESPRYSNVSRVILVVSTQPEEGKTITASNLALVFAASGKKTLLVDFDLRRPRIARIYDVVESITPETDLIEVLDSPEDTDFSNIAIPSEYDNLDLVVSSVSSSISPANVIGSEKLRAFFDWARVNYDHVVIDSPPFGLVSDAIQLGSFSDSVMIVCRPNRSRFGLVRNAISALKESGSNVIGVVVNEVNFNQASAFTNGSYSSYSNYSKYGKYGGRYGYGYGSYYKRSAKDDITVAPSANGDGDTSMDSHANDSPDSRPKHRSRNEASAEELDSDDED